MVTRSYKLVYQLAKHQKKTGMSSLMYCDVCCCIVDRL